KCRQEWWERRCQGRSKVEGSKVSLLCRSSGIRRRAERGKSGACLSSPFEVCAGSSQKLGLQGPDITRDCPKHACARKRSARKSQSAISRPATRLAKRFTAALARSPRSAKR